MLARRTIPIALGAACTGCVLILGYGDPVEVSARDGGAQGDAGVEAAKDAAIDAPFCETLNPKPTFCSSFDGPSFLAGFSGSASQNVKVERFTSSFVSPPASLRVALDRKDDGGVNGGVDVDFPAFENKPFAAKVAFDVRVEAAAPTGVLAVVANPLVIAAPGGPTYLLQLVCRPLADGSTVSVVLNEVKLTGASASEPHGSSQSLVVGKWMRVEIAVGVTSVTGTSNTAKLTVDGKVGYEGPLALPIGSGVPATNFGIAVVDPPTTAWSLLFDNTTVDIH